MAKKKLGFALGAGGSRGVAHVGFLKAMEEEGIYPDYIPKTPIGQDFFVRTKPVSRLL